MESHFPSKPPGVLQLAVVLWYGHVFPSQSAAPTALPKGEPSSPRNAQYTERCIEVRSYLFDKPGFNVQTFLSLTRKTLEKDLLAVKHSGRLNERSLCLSKELFPDSESPV